MCVASAYVKTRFLPWGADPDGSRCFQPCCHEGITRAFSLLKYLFRLFSSPSSSAWVRTRKSAHQALGASPTAQVGFIPAGGCGLSFLWCLVRRGMFCTPDFIIRPAVVQASYLNTVGFKSGSLRVCRFCVLCLFPRGPSRAVARCHLHALRDCTQLPPVSGVR